MKAIRIHEYGGRETLRYEDAPVPEPMAGELLVRVKADAVIDYGAVRFEEAAGGVDVVLDAVGGETQERSSFISPDGKEGNDDYNKTGE